MIIPVNLKSYKLIILDMQISFLMSFLKMQKFDQKRILAYNESR